MRVLVTGASGYIGGRLVPELLAAGHRVRCVSRRPEGLRGQPWAGDVETATADVRDAKAIEAALHGMDVAYYLVHAMGAGGDFEGRDREAASTFAGAAARAGVTRIIYLGGLASGGTISPHLRSRNEVGEILLAGEAPAIVLRAAMIIGSGSASFEMLRHLTERLPVMITPRWVETRIQPIAVRDVLRYLTACAAIPGIVRGSFDIGGPDVLTYAEMIQRYAAIAGLPRRLIVPVPVLTPALSSHWVGLVTPVPRALARPLVEGLRTEVVCRDHTIRALVPDPPEGQLGFDEAVELALRRIQEAAVATRWSSAATPGRPSDPLPNDPDWAGGSLYIDERTAVTRAPASAVWRVVEGIGGDNGWYSLPVAWRLRGALDRLVGGVGLRRGRRDPARLRVGDALDFWRVEEVVPGALLRLRAEMMLPGLAWLELGVHEARGRTVLRQRAVFHPHGLLGHLYWKALTPFHGVIFGRMPHNILRAAERQASSAGSLSRNTERITSGERKSSSSAR
ncbi:SDR family oxidoreductase [Actinocorallia sp. API 0066]|uniref:SDR family oxidoreductase n=1 Tax=Actinocorallia sp. API 0066 TaxID=2896846 RepID=UPI001E55BD6D|nr:SDR family oxidoreductase [Actinocorallia sp. API 0066]MCD0452403.1 SDR family oxidoreductase [Actinocorallia sp. API 0066]